MIRKIQNICKRGLKPTKTAKIFAGIVVSMLLLLTYATTSPKGESQTETDPTRPASTRYEQRAPVEMVSANSTWDAKYRR